MCFSNCGRLNLVGSIPWEQNDCIRNVVVPPKAADLLDRTHHQRWSSPKNEHRTETLTLYQENKIAYNAE